MSTKEKIIQKLSTTEWKTGSQIRKQLNDPDISIGDFYVTIEILVKMGIVDIFKPNDQTTAKFKMNPSKLNIIEIPNLIPNYV